MNKEHIIQVLKENGYSLYATTEDKSREWKAEYWAKNVLLKEAKNLKETIKLILSK
jgi:hypothetical protein